MRYSLCKLIHMFMCFSVATSTLVSEHYFVTKRLIKFEQIALLETFRNP